MKPIKFKYDRPAGDRRHYVDEEDVKIVLSRLPSELYSQLRAVYFKDDARGNRIGGYVTPGRKEVTLCALPPRISLGAALRRSQNPPMFGAVRGCQWPSLAVRRYLLYNTFLHELGHMQMINRKSKSIRRKYAGETKAQNFAEYWCKTLWSKPYGHHDSVHNSPSTAELEGLYSGWDQGHCEYKKGLIYEEKGKKELAVLQYTRAVSLYEGHPLALEALGIFQYEKVNSSSRAIGFLKRALDLDPTLHDANLFIGMSFADKKMESEAKFHFEKAFRIASRPQSTLAVFGRAMAGLGRFDEAKKLFRRAMKTGSRCPFSLHLYKQFLLHKDNPDREVNLKKAADLFDEKDFRITYEKISTYSRGLKVIYSWKR